MRPKSLGRSYMIDAGTLEHAYKTHGAAFSAGSSAVACFALMDDDKDAVKRNLEKARNAEPVTGQYRTFDGLVHYMSMLHLCGSFRLW